jgi:Fur family zinc uptake transcriptional regulator
LASSVRENHSFSGGAHDHRHCVETALHVATRICERQGARLTALRRRVLELVWRGHQPRGAYDILEELQREGRRAAPPTVYRALEFLRLNGLIHRIESLNAFIGCVAPGEPHDGHFLICNRCGGAAEVNDDAIGEAVAQSASHSGFVIEQQTIELRGLCPACQEPSPQEPSP